MGTLAVLNHEGDTTIRWDIDRPEEVAAARAMWDTLVGGKGYSAFSVHDDGSAGGRVQEFDPDLERVLLTPPMMGGQGVGVG